MWSMLMFKLLKTSVGSNLPTTQNHVLRGVFLIYACPQTLTIRHVCKFIIMLKKKEELLSD